MWLNEPPRISGEAKQDIRRHLAADPRAWHECQEGVGDPVAEIRLTFLGLTSVVGLEYVDIIDELARDARHAAQHAQRAIDALLSETPRDGESSEDRASYISEEIEQRDHYRRMTRLLLTCAEQLRSNNHPFTKDHGLRFGPRGAP